MGLTVLVCFDDVGMVQGSKLPHLTPRLAKDAIGANEYVPAKRRAIRADSSHTGGLMLDVDEALVNKNFALVLQVFIQHTQQILPFAPAGSIPRAVEEPP